MGVYIKGMEMPDNCGACYIGFCKQIDCERYIGFDDYARRRHPDCPLVEVPPHGRLIDADALKTDCDLVHSMMMFGGQKVYTQTAIDNAPTIIDADYPPSVPLEQVWTELFGEECE